MNGNPYPASVAPPAAPASAAPGAAPAAVPLELTLVRIASLWWGSLWFEAHLISFALQRFVSLLRFALEARAGNGFSLIESKCYSDRVEMLARWWEQQLLVSVRQRCVCAIFQTALEIQVRIAACLKMALVKSATTGTAATATAATDNSRRTAAVGGTDRQRQTTTAGSSIKSCQQTSNIK